jgi:hypothetical protein
VQALAKFVFEQQRGNTVPHVWMLGLRRSAVGCIVNTDRQEHVVEAFDATHRGLMLKDDVLRSRVTRAVLEIGVDDGFEVVDYTFDQVKELLSMLVRAGLVRDKYRDAALALLAEQP